MQADTTAGVLGDLIQTLEDGRKGFEQTADHLESQADRSITDRMRAFAEQRSSFSSELRSLAARQGFTIDEEGSMTGAMHRGWIGLKDALTGNDASAVLGAAESGEDHAVSEYEEALSQDLPAEIRTVIERQAIEVSRAHDEVRNLRDSL
ncbi:MAG: ferritin-like domain-containing protein [Acidimicrobiia bacterium]